VQSLGYDHIEAAADTLLPLLVRPSGPLANGGPAAAPALGDVLLALSGHIDSLNPYHQDDLSAGRKVLHNYLARYQQSQADLNVAIHELEVVEDEIRKDNTDLDQLRDKIADRMEPLRLHLYVAQRLESILTDRVAKWQEVDTARAIATRGRQAGLPGPLPGAGD
jgi:hypothetical protein